MKSFLSLITIFILSSVIFWRYPANNLRLNKGCLYSFQTSESSNNKKALIIANGIYQKGTRWRNISSHNDIQLIKKALKTQGFLESNINIKKDVTYDEFIKTMTTFKKKLKKDDIVFIHVSSHGQQIYDDNNDEKDRYDEAIIPVDAPQEYREKGYTGEKHIRDDELGELFDSMRKKIGVKGNLFAALDACHSGTGTRGYGKARGVLEPFQPKDYQATKMISSSFDLLKDDEDLAPAVYFYGSSANQLNYEYEIEEGSYVGSLSYALSKALSEADKNTSYQGLFDHVKRIMTTIAPRQTPQAEGILNQKILGGQLTGKKEYFLVTKYQRKNNDVFVRLNGGTLQGLYKGSTVAFYDIDGLDKRVKARGEIIKANAITSQVQLDEKISKSEMENSWVIISERNYGDMNIKVSINLKQKDIQHELTSIIDTIGFISINNSTPDLIIESVGKPSLKDSIQIYTKDDCIFWKKERRSSVGYATYIMEEIKRYARVNFIRRLEMQNKELEMTFDFIPLLMKDDGVDSIVEKEIPVERKKNATGTVVFHEGDNTYVDITNHSKKSLYYTLLDIQPDNRINILIPHGNYTASDFYLRPGESYKHQIEFYPPFGSETFKLIASEEPIDLRPILRTKGEETGKRNSNPFEVLFQNSYKNNTRFSRRGETVNIPNGVVNIYTVVFEIESN